MKRQQLLLAAWAFLVFGLSVRAFAGALVADGGAQQIVVQPRTFEVNHASVVELELLPGLGRTRAEAIVLDRIRNGAFHSLADLIRVDGLGPSTIDAVVPYLHCDSLPTPSSRGRR